MSVLRRRHFALPFLLAAASAPLAAAQAADCAGGSGGALTVGQAQRVEPGPARTYTLDLAAGQGVIVDLSSLAAPAPKAADGDEHDGEGDKPKAAPQTVKLCNASGVLLAPQPGEVFEKGGSVTTTAEGQRLRFVAPAAGRYTVWVADSGDAREVIARNRDLGKGGALRTIKLGGEETGNVSSAAPVTFTFAGTAGQWVEIKAKSESDTVLHLAGPDRSGAYSEIASNDDSDGLNPLIRRRLPVTGTYYVQIDSLADNSDSYTLNVSPTQAPPPPAPPVALRPGAQIDAKLSGEDDARLYALPVTAGHSYRLELTAAYDGVVAIGLPNPVESDDGKEGAAAGFSEVKSQDSGTTGTERLNFTARSTGQLLVLVKSFGIGDTDGSYKLVATDLGG
ncbi:MAG: PPC domain-containing protein [Sphingomonadales bacterium]|nr:PPC domain-containing protein [Sphingomonadales bacterium]